MRKQSKKENLRKKIDSIGSAVNALQNKIDAGEITEEMIQADLGIYLPDMQRNLDNAKTVLDTILLSY